MKKEVLLIPLIVVALGMIVLWTISQSYESSSQGVQSASDGESEDTLLPQPPEHTGQGDSQDSAGSSGGGAGGSGSGEIESETGTPINSEEDRVYCTPESRTIESCPSNDHPVCGWFDPDQVSCESGPCVRSTFPNECEACIAPTILYWTEGECPIHE